MSTDTFIQFVAGRPADTAADRAERARTTPEYMAGYAAAYEKRPLARQDAEYIRGYLDQQRASFDRIKAGVRGAVA